MLTTFYLAKIKCGRTLFPGSKKQPCGQIGLAELSDGALQLQTREGLRALPEADVPAPMLGLTQLSN